MMLGSRAAIMDVLREELRAMDPYLPAQVREDADFRSDLGFDSLALTEYVARVEQRFRMAVPDDEWQALRTLDGVASYLMAREQT